MTSRNLTINNEIFVVPGRGSGLKWAVVAAIALVALPFIPGVNTLVQSGINKVVPGSAHTLGSRLMTAITEQESGNDYSAVNPDSGALGIGQVMPDNVGPWSKEILGYEISTEEFLTSPNLQDQIVSGKLQQYIDKERAEGHGEKDAVRRAASTWYSGDPDLADDTTPQFYNGREYPSISEYYDQVWARYLSAEDKSLPRWGFKLPKLGVSFEVEEGSEPTVMISPPPAVARLANNTPRAFMGKTFPIPGRSLADTTSPWGPRKSEPTPNGNTSDFHKGHDIDCDIGEIQVATEAGRIEHINDRSGLGPYTVALIPASGSVDRIIYGHSSKRLVANGAWVFGGTPITECGTEGLSTGPHLHIEVEDRGERVNPLSYLQALN